MSASDIELARAVFSRIEPILVGSSRIGSERGPIKIRQALAQASDRDFLIVAVTYEVDGQLASIEYGVDDWRDGASEREASAVAVGIASLVRIAVMEHADTGEY